MIPTGPDGPRCLQRPELFGRYGVEPPKGVLLWGPPGTGKTRLAAAAAANAEAALFVINGPDLVSAFYGHSEQSLKVGTCKGLAVYCRFWMPNFVYSSA